MTIRSRIGDRVPICAAAGAKAMIAYYDPDPVEALLAEEMRRFTTQTITDLKTLKRELEKAKKQGVAFCREEISVGVNATCVPLFNHENKPVAAAVIVGLVSRVKCEMKLPMVMALKKTASDISAQLFHEEPMATTG